MSLLMEAFIKGAEEERDRKRGGEIRGGQVHEDEQSRATRLTVMEFSFAHLCFNYLVKYLKS